MTFKYFNKEKNRNEMRDFTDLPRAAQQSALNSATADTLRALAVELADRINPDAEPKGEVRVLDEEDPRPLPGLSDGPVATRHKQPHEPSKAQREKQEEE